jgi:hypothetical protein
VTIVITWAMFKWSGLVLAILSLVVLFGGDLPDHHGNPVLNALRWVVWPLMLAWLCAIFVHGLL